MYGKEIVTKKLKNQLKNTAILVAIPLYSVLNSSAVTSNGIGPKNISYYLILLPAIIFSKIHSINIPGPRE